MNVLRVGIVCEGSTDYPVLRQVVQAVANRPIVFSELQPDFDALQQNDLDPIGPGWQGVRAFLGAGGAAVSASRYDIIIVHVDADIRWHSEIQPRLRALAGDEEALEPLCEHIRSWIGGTLPEQLLIVLPREAIESWLLAAHTKRVFVERIQDPVAEMTADHLLDARPSGGADKRRSKYQCLSKGLPELLKDRRKMSQRVPELARFVGKLQHRLSVIRRSSGR